MANSGSSSYTALANARRLSASSSTVSHSRFRIASISSIFGPRSLAESFSVNLLEMVELGVEVVSGFRLGVRMEPVEGRRAGLSDTGGELDSSSMGSFSVPTVRHRDFGSLNGASRSESIAESDSGSSKCCGSRGLREGVSTPIWKVRGTGLRLPEALISSSLSVLESSIDLAGSDIVTGDFGSPADISSVSISACADPVSSESLIASSTCCNRFGSGASCGIESISELSSELSSSMKPSSDDGSGSDSKSSSPSGTSGRS